jgi:multidrug efflux pump subunit AcrB
MNLTQVAFTYRKTVFMLLTILLINGVFAYFTLPAREDPSITIREAIVSTSYPGMSPERVELLITKTLEEEIRKIPEVQRLRSSSSTGLSVIHVKVYDRYFNLDSIWQSLRNKVDQAQGMLPSGTRPSQVNDEFGDVSVLTLALTADGFDMSHMHDIAKHTRDSLYAVAGTKKIELMGEQAERIYLETSNARLAQLGMSPQLLMQALQTQNIISSGGQVDTGEKSFIIEPTGNFDKLEELSGTYINIPGTNESIALSDIVSIKRGYIDPPNKLAYYNGQAAIIFAISMLPEYNILEYAPRLKQAIQAVESTLPIGYKMHIATYQAEQVAKTLEGVSVNVMQTLAIVLVVVILFLGLRTGLIVGAIVPFVMLVTLSIMQFSDVKLERMSLATLIIALGLLVDNGIVIAEDFKRRLEKGAERFQAMCQGGKELALPLLSSSLTTILFFLPLMLAEHVAGEFTRSISLVILITLMSSWVLALCVTPILCFYFIKVDEDKMADNKSPSKRNGLYEQFLHGVLRYKLLFTGGLILLFVLSIMAMKFVPKQFFPQSDRTQLVVNIDLPSGSSERQTNEQMKRIMAWLGDKSETGSGFDFIEHYAAYVGFSGPRFVLSLNPEDPAENKAFMVLNMVPGIDLDRTARLIDQSLEHNFANISVRVKKMFLGPSDSSTIKIQVKGPDKDIIYAKAQQVVDLLYTIPNTQDIRTDWENLIVKIEVQVDQQRARRVAVTSEDIAKSLQAYFSGALVTEYREGDDIIPIMFRAADAERYNLDRLRSLSVFSQSTGQAVPLFQIAEFAPISQYSIIQREDMFRTVSIEARNSQMAAEDLKSIIDEDIQRLANDLPVNHHIEYDGVVVDSISAQKALSASMPMVLGLILILLVAQFNSFKRASIIVLTIPLSFIGAVIGLLVMDASFGFMVTLGLYSLAGIIINNAIVLIDKIDIERAQGASDYDALINACITRLRPITMTTITTVMGLLPLIISRDPLFYGMANVIAFGLAVGTVLTLGFVPVLYASFFKLSRDTNSQHSQTI